MSQYPYQNSCGLMDPPPKGSQGPPQILRLHFENFSGGQSRTLSAYCYHFFYLSTNCAETRGLGEGRDPLKPTGVLSVEYGYTRISELDFQSSWLEVFPVFLFLSYMT